MQVPEFFFEILNFVTKHGLNTSHVCAPIFLPSSAPCNHGRRSSAGQTDAEEVMARTTVITIISSHDGSRPAQPTLVKTLNGIGRIQTSNRRVKG